MMSGGTTTSGFACKSLHNAGVHHQITAQYQNQSCTNVPLLDWYLS
jgi:hypothetical protein